MEIVIFCKKKETKEGKKFNHYFTRLKHKTTGEEIPMDVKFREECGSPKDCPCNIVVEKNDCNIATRTFTREDTGEECIAKTLWVTKWKEGSPYVDHSTDDFM